MKKKKDIYSECNNSDKAKKECKKAIDKEIEAKKFSDVLLLVNPENDDEGIALKMAGGDTVSAILRKFGDNLPKEEMIALVDKLVEKYGKPDIVIDAYKERLFWLENPVLKVRFSGRANGSNKDCSQRDDYTEQDVVNCGSFMMLDGRENELLIVDTAFTNGSDDAATEGGGMMGKLKGLFSSKKE